MLHRAYDPAWAVHGRHAVFAPPAPLRLLGFELVTLEAGADPVQMMQPDAELAVVILQGTVAARVGDARWTELGGRANVFEGPATTLYVPPGERLETWTATGRAELAVCSARAHPHPTRRPFVVWPTDVEVVRRGTDHWHREVRNILTPGVGGDTAAIVVGETVSDAGEWSGYPPHRHEQDSDQERAFEELYHYRLAPPDGFGVQVHYGAAGYSDTGYLVHDKDSFAIPSGYHPVVVQGGYRLYYLWCMAGPSGRELRPFEDPRYRWVQSGA